ncbi:MAG: hypothetical protein ABI399_00180 [Bauldia sp.]
MKLPVRLATFSAMSLIFVGGAVAGAPLKGIDVKLGRNPGGGCAVRASNQCTSQASDQNGNFNFGVLPKGNYEISLVLPSGRIDAGKATKLVIRGAKGGSINRVLKGATPLAASNTTKAIGNPAGEVAFASDGAHGISGSVSADP